MCALCGADNGCLLARSPGSDVAECWCAGERFPRSLLERAGATQEEKTCICRRCLEAEKRASEASP